MTTLVIRLSRICSRYTIIELRLDLLLITEEIRIIGDEDLAAAGTASTTLTVEICTCLTVRHRSSCEVEGDRHTGTLPVTGRKDTSAGLDRCWITGQITILIEASRIRKLLAGETIHAELTICILAHRHIEDDRAALTRNRDTERVVTYARLLRAPHRHTALGIGPADTDEAGLCCLPCIGAATHPVGRVLQCDAADTMYLCELDRTIHAEGGIQCTDAEVTIVVLDGTLRTNQLRLRLDIDPALLYILCKTRYTVEAVALDALEAALGVDLCTLLCLRLR